MIHARILIILDGGITQIFHGMVKTIWIVHMEANSMADSKDTSLSHRRRSQGWRTCWLSISATETRFQNQDATIKVLENQIGQLDKMIASRELCTLPSNTEKNPKEQVMTIKFMSGKLLDSKDEESSPRKQEEGHTDKHQGKSSNSTPPHNAPSKVFIPHPFPATLKKAKLYAIR